MAVVGINTAASNAGFYLNSAALGLSGAIRRLASGDRLTNVEDDAAGVGVSGNLNAGIRKLHAAVDGVQTLISLAQTADGYLKAIQDQLTRMSELALRAHNGTFSSSDRTNYQTEFGQLNSNITNQISNSKFNGIAVFGAGASVSTVVSANGDVQFTLSLADAASSVSGVSALSVSSTAGASAAIGTLTSALESITTDRAQMGAYIDSLSFYMQNLEVERVNVTSTNSRIQDADVAEESVLLAKASILSQAATSMLAQANASPRAVLGLLR